MDKQKKIEWLKGRISSMEQCRDEIPFGLSEDESMELYAYKDSLASLTAEPVAYMTYKGYLLHADDPKLSEYSDPEPLYDAPPVPEIKLPSLELIKEVFLANGFKEKVQADGSHDLNMYVYDAVLALLERLNGLGE